MLTSHVSIQALQACYDDGDRRGPTTPFHSWARVRVDSATIPIVVSARSVCNRNCFTLVRCIYHRFTVLTHLVGDRTNICSFTWLTFTYACSHIVHTGCSRKSEFSTSIILHFAAVLEETQVFYFTRSEKLEVQVQSVQPGSLYTSLRRTSPDKEKPVCSPRYCTWFKTS
jgi:hypothetical protein